VAKFFETRNIKFSDLDFSFGKNLKKNIKNKFFKIAKKYLTFSRFMGFLSQKLKKINLAFLKCKIKGLTELYYMHRNFACFILL